MFTLGPQTAYWMAIATQGEMEALPPVLESSAPALWKTRMTNGKQQVLCSESGISRKLESKNGVVKEPRKKANGNKQEQKKKSLPAFSSLLIAVENKAIISPQG